MRILADGTPLFGARTGVGRYVAELFTHLPAALAQHAPGTALVAYTWTARGGRLTDLPEGVAQRGIRIPARLVYPLWQRLNHPTMELLAGNADVVHGTNFVVGPTRRAKQVTTIHDLTYLDLPETVAPAIRRFAPLVQRALDRGAHVLTPSETVAAAVRERYQLPASRVTATLLGVDPAWFDATADPSLPGRLGIPAGYLLFVGGLEPRKNLPALLRAHAAARTANPDMPDLVLAGPAGRQADLAGHPGVHLTGFLSDDDLRAVVAGAVALVLPSLDEGFGLPVAEALAAGRPVVISDIPTLREVAGEHGIVANPTDDDALAAALLASLDAPGDDAARADRRAWARRYDWAACAATTAKVYLA